MEFRQIDSRVSRPVAMGAVVALAVAVGWFETRHNNFDHQRIYLIGFDDQPPQHFVGPDGRPTGLAVDLIDEAARRSKIHIKWQLEPESSEVALKSKKVDLWPLMTIRPERQKIVYITDPYREDTICLFVRSNSAFNRLEDLGNSTIAYDGEPLDARLLWQYAPKAKLTIIESPRQRLEAVCRGRADAGYSDEYTALATLMDGIACEAPGLRLIQLPELSGKLGIGATFESRPVADSLRDEIGAMAADGSLDRIASRWRSFSGGNLEIARELTRAQSRERWLIIGISTTFLLLLATLWQTARVRRALATAKEATALKNQFLANMSHEIRTPMNAIIGMTALAMDTKDGEEQAEYLRDVMQASESLLSLLNDILDFSKIEAGKLTFERVVFAPAGVVSDVCGLFAEIARGKGLDLNFQTAAELPKQVWGDPTRLRQALVNLTGNAIKFTERGHIDLEAAVESETDDLVRIRFVVADTGIGICQQAQERIFESFVQADGSMARKYGGTGLGLSISRELISRMGGELQVESAPGRGSKFWFTLTFEKVRETPEGARSPEDHLVGKT